MKGMGGCGRCLSLVALLVSTSCLQRFGFIIGLAGETGLGRCGRDGGWRGRRRGMSASVSGCGG